MKKRILYVSMISKNSHHTHYRAYVRFNISSTIVIIKRRDMAIEQDYKYYTIR